MALQILNFIAATGALISLIFLNLVVDQAFHAAEFDLW